MEKVRFSVQVIFSKLFFKFYFLKRYPVNATTSLFVIDKECHLIKNTEIDPTIEQYLLDTYRFMTYVAFEADCYNVTANKIDYYCLLQVKYIF